MFNSTDKCADSRGVEVALISIGLGKAFQHIWHPTPTLCLSLEVIDKFFNGSSAKFYSVYALLYANF